MPSAREIRERIDSIQSTLKITNAMYMISSAKLNSARGALTRTEPYFYALQGMFERVLRHLPPDFSHPYLNQKHTENPEDLHRAIICVTADKGLAGAYNHNVLKLAEEGLRPDSNDMLFVVGEVGRDYFERRHVNVDEQFHYTAQKPTLARARAISSRMLELYTQGKVDEVYLIYTVMENAMEAKAQVTPLLPLSRLHSQAFEGNIGMAYSEDFHMEPSPAKLLDNIIPDFVSGYVYSALVESYCAEHSSRMQAMDSANRSGQDLVSRLTLEYNRQRQQAITQEITEIAAGARARRQQIEKARKRREHRKDTAYADR